MDTKYHSSTTGTLGQAFARICEIHDIPYHLLSRQEMDITDSTSVERTLNQLKTWAVINATGYVRVDDAEREPDLCHRMNAKGATILAKACGDWGIAMVKFSSDLVFDGNRADPYPECSSTHPLPLLVC